MRFQLPPGMGQLGFFAEHDQDIQGEEPVPKHGGSIRVRVQTLATDVNIFFPANVGIEGCARGRADVVTLCDVWQSVGDNGLWGIVWA